jgi:hypothetical protein
MLRDFEASIKDCRRAIDIDSTFIKAYLRAAKCLLNVGNVRESLDMLLLANHVCSENQKLRDNKILIEREVFFLILIPDPIYSADPILFINYKRENAIPILRRSSQEPRICIHENRPFSSYNPWILPL